MSTIVKDLNATVIEEFECQHIISPIELVVPVSRKPHRGYVAESIGITPTG